MRTSILFVLFVISTTGTLLAQPWFPIDNNLYRDDVLPRVDIAINPDTLNWLYENVASNVEFHATFYYTVAQQTDTVENIGFRLRGNTSRFSAKKSFKVSFNTFIKGQKYLGVEKLNLNGEHNDPSIIRSFLGWHICEDLKIPGARTNHVKVYINGDYYGLYANVEHIDEEFIEKRYGHNFGNLYKCLYGANLQYLGTDPQNYANNNYILKTNKEQFDYSRLMDLTYVISNTSPSNFPYDLEPIFNVNGFLRYLAMETFISHWDAYSINQNNYYLYENRYTGKIEFIPYDLDNTFGIDWFLGNLAERDIYNWGDMILTDKILQNQVYKDRYSFFLNEIITKYVNTTSYFDAIDNKRDQISAAAESDPYRPLDYGWSYTDFLNSYNQALGDHVTYGIKPYLTQRINSINNQIDLNPIAPIIENVYHNFAGMNQDIKIKANITDDQPGFTAKVFWKFNESDFTAVDLINDSLDVYRAVLGSVSQSGTVAYYILATDASGKTTRDPYAGTYSMQFGSSSKQLVISEFMASNSEVIYDNYGETDDWLEIHNVGNQAVSLSGLYLTDDPGDQTQWQLPDVTLQPNDYYLVWADNDEEQGDNHTNFKLSAGGEFIGIFDSFENNNLPIDTLTFSEQESNVSYGLNANGQYVAQAFATPMGLNESENVAFITFHYNMNRQIQIGNFNPAQDFIDIAGTFNDWSGSVHLFDDDEDGIYTATLFGFTADQTIEYKARINADWSGGEFYEMGGDGNRVYTTVSGSNELSHWFNDEPLDINQHLSAQEISVYPNPVSGTQFTITGNLNHATVTIYNINGNRVYQSYIIRESSITLENLFEPGMYMVQISAANGSAVKKLLIQ